LVLADDGFLSTGISGPDAPGVVTAVHDERGEVGIVVVRAETQRALAVWMLTWTKAGQLP
jgi:hypothetical protein